MSTYRFLAPHSVGQFYYEAGSTASTADTGGTLPTGWVPSNMVDPLDAAAVNALWSAGPQQLGSIHNYFSTQYVAPPVTWWRPTNIPGGGTSWQLQGLGSSLPPISN